MSHRHDAEVDESPDRYRPFGLTEIQESFFAGRMIGSGGGTHIHLEFEVPALDPDRLQASWNRLVAATDMLRARLLPDARQVVEPDVPEYRIVHTDLAEASQEEQQVALAGMRREAAAGMAPHRWPLFAVRAATLPGRKTRVMLTVDELIADGPSVSLLLQDWYGRYRFGEEPTAPGISFREYTLSTAAAGASEVSLGYWQDKLAAVDFDRPLPVAVAAALSPAAPGTDEPHRRLVLRVDAEQWGRAKDSAQRAGATPSALLLALCAAALQNEAAEPAALPVVLTTYNRRRIHPDVPRLVGPFLSTSVFVAPRPASTLGELLSEVRGQLWRDLEHAEVSGVRALRERARTAPGRRSPPVPLVFTSLFGSISDQRADPDNWAVRVDLDASAIRTAGVQLEICVQERAGALCVSWDYLPDVLDEAKVRSALANVEAALEQVAGNGEAAWSAPAAGPLRLPLTEVQSAYLVGRLGGLDGGVETRVYQELVLDHHHVDALEVAWNRLVAHHPMLRAAVRADGTVEVVPEVPHYRIDRHDLTGLGTEPAGLAAVDRALAEVATRLRGAAFPLGTRPMYALEASMLPDGRLVLHVVLDALLADARSFATLFGQLFALHDGDATVTDRLARGRQADPGPYLRGLAARRRGDRAEATRQEWRRKFADLPSGPALPDPPAGAERIHRRTCLGSWRALRERAAAIGVPADMVLLTAYTDELRRACDGPFTVTVVSWDRPADLPGAEHLVADFTQLAWVVVDDTLPAGFADRSRELWARTRADLKRGETVPGLAELRGRVFRSGGGLRLPVVFTRVPEIDPGLHPRGVRLRASQSQTAQVALDHVPLLAGDDLIGQWDAAEGCLERGQLDAMFDGYAARVRAFVNGEQPRHPPLMTELLTDSLRRHAHRPAVRGNGHTVSYSELDRRTAQLAHELAHRGVRPGEHVAVHLDRSEELVVALVGIVRAGAVYVPVDPVNPPQRVRHLLEDSGARLILTDAARATVAASAGASVLCLDHEPDLTLLARHPATAPHVPVGPDDPVYTIYTSGTTGGPKGCPNTHRGLVNRLLWMQERFPLSADDRVAQKTPYGFDVSVWEFFWPLLAGASIVVARPGGHADPGYLAQLFSTERVTVTHFVPSVLSMFLRDPGAGGCTALRYVFTSGEALPVGVMRRFFEVLPGGTELHNLYGPTEAAIDVTHWPCRPDWAEPTVPIGRPIANTHIHLVDERFRRVPDGTPGEIVIGGWGVALGYHRRSELTAERFVPSPFHDDPSPRLYRTGDLGQRGSDGEIRYLGRIDGQFKLRGLRIEPEEIEAALAAVPGVVEARVLPVTHEAAQEQILAALCVPADAEAAPSAAEIRRVLADSLPSYLVPSRFRFVAALPLTSNGKLDRAAAAASFGPVPVAAQAPSPEAVAGQTHTAVAVPATGATVTPDVVASLAAGLLGLPEADPDADLFDLGATSFTMIRLAQLLGERFDVNVEVDALLQTPTARSIAASRRAEPPASASRGSGRADLRIAFDPQAKAAFKEARVAERQLPAAPFRVPLPPAGPDHPRALYDASSVREFATGPVPVEGLLALLTTLAWGELDRRAKRRYPSAGGFYPVQVYLYLKPGALEGAESGLYYLDPRERALVALDPAARFGTEIHVFHNRALVDRAAFGVFLVSTPGAIAPAYGERNAARFSLVETGHIAQLLTTEAPKRGLGLCVVGEMDFDAVREHFELKDGQELLLSLWGGALTTEAVRRRDALVPTRVAQPPAPLVAPQQPAAPQSPRAVAVVGFAARLPGADTLEELDALLASGGSAAGPLPEQRWAPLTGRTRRAGARLGGYLDEVTAVEAGEFGLADGEAAAVDPQERLLLSVVRRCFEDAALTPESLSAGEVGMFVGSMWHDHALYGVAARAEGRPGTYPTRGGLAHRTSHAFNLSGPSLLIDTGCLSGLAAVETAFRAVAAGRCAAAVAAGVNLVLHPDHLDVLADMGLVAEEPDSCAFTDRASGWILGEGVGAVLLKPLEAAVADGDPIHAVLRGGALAHSGTSRKFGIPNPAKLEEVMRGALADAGLRPEDVGYVEAAAAGSGLADALEFTAVGRLFGERAGAPVPVGSVKPNTGHLEGASVFAQLGKVIAQFRRDRLYPTRVTSAPNPALAQGQGAVLAVEPAALRWRTVAGEPRVALVNGFAGGGSYGSLVVEEPPTFPARREATAAEPAYTLPLSADTPQNLARFAVSLAEAMDRNPGLPLASVARSLRQGRRARPARGSVVAERDRASAALLALADRVLGQGAGVSEQLTAVLPEEQAALTGWLAGAEPVWPPLPGGPRRCPLPTVPLTVTHVPLTAPAETAAAAGTAGEGTPFARLARVVAAETDADAGGLAASDDLFALGVSSRQLLRITARIAADGGRQLPLESLFTAADLGALAALAYPAPPPYDQ